MFKSINIKPISVPKISTTRLTMPKNTIKVGLGVKPQHVSKVNWGKSSSVKQKSSAQL